MEISTWDGFTGQLLFRSRFGFRNNSTRSRGSQSIHCLRKGTKIDSLYNHEDQKHYSRNKSAHELAIMTYVLGFSRNKGPSVPRNKYPRWAVGNKVSKKYCQKTIHEIFQQNTHRLTHELSKN